MARNPEPSQSTIKYKTIQTRASLDSYFIRFNACLMAQLHNLNTEVPRHCILWLDTAKCLSKCLNLSKIFVMNLDLHLLELALRMTNDFLYYSSLLASISTINCCSTPNDENSFKLFNNVDWAKELLILCDRDSKDCESYSWVIIYKVDTSGYDCKNYSSANQNRF